MRYAVVSDVHSNIDSLETVLAMLHDDDALLCLGDIVGYGPNPNECVERIRARATATVLGNHDVAAVDNFGLAYFNPAAREAMKWTQSVLTPENVAWLDSLGYEFRMPDFLLVHGAPVNYFEYILDKPAAARAFAATDAPIIFIGHTHIAEVYTLHPDGGIAHAHLQQGGEVPLEDGARYLINVGSVGQPRDRDRRSSFVIVNDTYVEFVRLDYDVETTVRKIHDNPDLDNFLGTRLLDGR